MPTRAPHATIHLLPPRNRDRLPDGIAGTVSGASAEMIDLASMRRLGSHGVRHERSRGITRGGAVSGAARVTSSSAGARGGGTWGIALSDGSEITFVSVADVCVLHETGANFLTTG